MKIHLKDSGVPLIERESQTALCGELIPDAQFAFLWDDIGMGEALEMNSLRCCRKCVLAASDLQLGRYVYGIRFPEKTSMRGAA